MQIYFQGENVSILYVAVKILLALVKSCISQSVVLISSWYTKGNVLVSKPTGYTSVAVISKVSHKETGRTTPVLSRPELSKGICQSGNLLTRVPHDWNKESDRFPLE